MNTAAIAAAGELIDDSTARYEAWLGTLIEVNEPDLAYKATQMAAEDFPFLRATFYWWAEALGAVCPQEIEAPQVVGVGDVHIQNFGTWRDAEGRLVWGLNDFDEAVSLPYTNDLIRLCSSVLIGVEDRQDPSKTAKAVLAGYRSGIESGPSPFILDGKHPELAKHAADAHDQPAKFWEGKKEKLREQVIDPAAIADALKATLPAGSRIEAAGHRRAGLGSLGRPRWTVIAHWHGGLTAREAKPLLPSAWEWAHNPETTMPAAYEQMIDHPGRCPDPGSALIADGAWVVRRLSSDSDTIELDKHGLKHHLGEQDHVLHAMGKEIATIHSAGDLAAVRADLDQRVDHGWLVDASSQMAEATRAAWAAWARSHPVDDS